MKVFIISIIVLSVLVSSIEAKSFTKCKTNHLMTEIIRNHRRKNGIGHTCLPGANMDSMWSFMSRCQVKKLKKLEKKLEQDKISQCQFDCQVTKKCMKYRLSTLTSIFRNQNYWSTGQGAWQGCNNRECKAEKWCAALPDRAPHIFWKPEQCIDQFATAMSQLAEQLHYIKQLQQSSNNNRGNRWGWGRGRGRGNSHNNEAQIDRHILIAQEKWRLIGTLVEGDCLSNLFSGFETLNVENQECFGKLNQYFIWLRIFLTEPTLENMQNLNLDFNQSQNQWKNIFSSCKINCDLETGDFSGECPGDNNNGGGNEEGCVDPATNQVVTCTGPGENMIFYPENDTCDCQTITCQDGENLCQNPDPTLPDPWSCQPIQTTCPDYYNIQNPGSCNTECVFVPLGDNEVYVQNADGTWSTTCAIYSNQDSNGACVLVTLGDNQEYYQNDDGTWTTRCVQYANDLGNGNCDLITLGDNQEYFTDANGNWGARCVANHNQDSTGACVAVDCTESGASIVETTGNGQTPNNYVCMCPTNQALSFDFVNTATCTCPSTAPIRLLEDGKAACGCPAGQLPQLNSNGDLICETPITEICEAGIVLDAFTFSEDPTCNCPDGTTLRRYDTDSAVCGCPSKYRDGDDNGTPICELIPQCSADEDLGFTFTSANTQTTCICESPSSYLKISSNGNAVCGSCPSGLIQNTNSEGIQTCDVILPCTPLNDDLGSSTANCDCIAMFITLDNGNLACPDCTTQGFVTNTATGACEEEVVANNCDEGVALANTDCTCDAGFKTYPDDQIYCGATCLTGFTAGPIMDGVESCVPDNGLGICTIRVDTTNDIQTGIAYSFPATPPNPTCNCDQPNTEVVLTDSGFWYCQCQATYLPSSDQTFCGLPATNENFDPNNQFLFSSEAASTGYFNEEVGKFGCVLTVVDAPMTGVNAAGDVYMNCACARDYGLTADWYDANDHIPSFFTQANAPPNPDSTGSHCCKDFNFVYSDPNLLPSDACVNYV